MAKTDIRIYHKPCGGSLTIKRLRRSTGKEQDWCSFCRRWVTKTGDTDK